MPEQKISAEDEKKLKKFRTKIIVTNVLGYGFLVLLGAMFVASFFVFPYIKANIYKFIYVFAGLAFAVCANGFFYLNTKTKRESNAFFSSLPIVKHQEIKK